MAAGQAAWNGTVDGVKVLAHGAAFEAGFLTMSAFATGQYIWDTKLRPAAVGGGSTAYEIFFKDASSCNATLPTYVCTSLSAWLNMQ